MSFTRCMLTQRLEWPHCTEGNIGESEDLRAHAEITPTTSCDKWAWLQI